MAAFRRKHLSKHAVAEAVTLATITAIVGYLNRFLRIDMTESMALLFRECEGGGDHQGLCQSVYPYLSKSVADPQDFYPMENGQLITARYDNTHRPDRHLLRLQSPLWNLCPLHGGRCILWEIGGHIGESAIYGLSGCTALCGLCARRALYHAGDLCFPWRCSCVRVSS